MHHPFDERRRAHEVKGAVARQPQLPTIGASSAGATAPLLAVPQGGTRIPIGDRAIATGHRAHGEDSIRNAGPPRDGKTLEGMGALAKTSVPSRIPFCYFRQKGIRLGIARYKGQHVPYDRAPTNTAPLLCISFLSFS